MLAQAVGVRENVVASNVMKLSYWMFTQLGHDINMISLGCHDMLTFMMTCIRLVSDVMMSQFRLSICLLISGRMTHNECS